MMRVFLFSLIALFLLAVSTIGAHADVEGTWKDHRTGEYAEAVKALWPETSIR